MRRSSLLAGVLAVLACLFALPSVAGAVQHGPDPTVASLQASTGPYAISQTSVADANTPGFGAATIYYPTTTAEGAFGGVAISPGFTETQSAISWLGPRLASNGFVVITFNTNSSLDSPATRGTELLAALDYLTGSSAVKTRVDATHLAVMGHSMGGGATLEAAKARPSLKAAIGLAPWDTDKTWPEITTPALMVGAQNDTVAPPGQHAIPFYNSIPATTPKAYLELAGADHFATNSPNTTVGAEGVAWLKRFVDGDTRFSPFLCPSPSAAPAGAVSQYLSNCPF
jgi:alpha-beta hydrolase superfamily lysophospholipase